MLILYANKQQKSVSLFHIVGLFVVRTDKHMSQLRYDDTIISSVLSCLL